MLNLLFRQSNPITTNLIYEIEYFKDDPEQLIFILKDGYTINIVIADMLHNSVEEICQIVGYDLSHIKILEDLSAIYIIQSIQEKNISYQLTYGLFECKWGKDIDFTKGVHKPVIKLGYYVTHMQVLLGTSICAYYNTNDGNKILIYNSDSHLIFDDEYGDGYYAKFSILEETQELLVIGETYGSRNIVYVRFLSF